ncbi:hypothetical protein EZS27_010915 [termite gut metagenome]|uniref:Uncharacterized protein n=1 Tax=termite gut metagenome TaxID=433724 RepID=A0A5J4S5A5_9ZZZZ
MADFYDTSGWNEKLSLQTKGVRNKCIITNPKNDCDYYFKTSIKKGEKDYKSEFWSEIIASKIGKILGFNILKYDIALHNEEIGCISKSMINNGECLIEGISLLTGYDNTYKPDSKKSYSLYTFQFITMLESFINRGVAEIRWNNTENKLKHFKLIKKIKEKYPEKVRETIKNILSKYIEQEIENIVYQIDIKLPDIYKKDFGLSDERKKLICIILKERITRLKQLE